MQHRILKINKLIIPFVGGQVETTAWTIIANVKQVLKAISWCSEDHLPL